jgi:hypothetical protein
LIEVERHLNDRHRLKGGQIRIVDHLRNGNKSIIMTNRSLKAYINHRRGGSIFELDFVARGMNVTAGYASQRHTDPSVIEAGRSKMAFVDHLVAPQTTASDFVGGTMSELGDFVQGWYEYKVMKSKAGVKAMLSRQGSVVQGEKSCPLTMEKVFGFEGDRADLSFVYQLGNQTVTPYRFVFATEMTFSLGGAVGGKALLRCGKEWYGALARERVFLEGVTEVALEDSQYGIRVLLKTQKPVQVWCYPVGGGAGSNAAYQGTTVVIALPVTLGANSLWSLMGKLMLRGIRRK